MMWRRTPTFLTALLSAMLISGCGSDASSNSAQQEFGDVPEDDRYGGTVVIAGYGDLQSLNSLVSTDNNSSGIQRGMLDMPLVKYDADLNPVPWLAESWDTVRVAPDSIDLVFHLRDDVYWHDGEPTDAEDVLFTFERAIDPNTAFANISAFDQYSPDAEIIDPYTIRFRLRPHSDFLDIWYQTPPMPEHILGDVPAAELRSHPYGTSAAVGNGPFRFVRHDQGQQWIFDANPEFPEELGGRPYVDRVVWRYIPEMTTLLTELLTGTIDVYIGPNPNQAATIESSPNTRLIAAPNPQWNYLAFNNRRPFFEDARVRRAIGLALDRQAMVDAVVYGYGEVGRSTVTPAHWSFDGDDPETLLPHDPERARELLAEAGWVDRDNDGILENEEGTPFRFTLITNAGNDVRIDMTQIIQAQLRPFGIAVDLREIEWNTMTAMLRDPARNFDAVISGWVDSFRKDDRDILHSENIDKPYQYVGFSNARADELIDTLAVITDRDEAMPLWKEYQHLIVQEAPYLPLYYPERLTGLNTRLQDVVMDVRGEFANTPEWWIPPALRREGRAVTEE